MNFGARGSAVISMSERGGYGILATVEDVITMRFRDGALSAAARSLETLWMMG